MALRDSCGMILRRLAGVEPDATCKFFLFCHILIAVSGTTYLELERSHFLGFVSYHVQAAVLSLGAEADKSLTSEN